MDTVYIETTIISHLRQKPSSQVVTAARQLLTHQWWDDERQNYQLVVSQYVIDEASSGDPTLAADRLQALDGIPLLPHDPEIPRIAAEIMAIGAKKRGRFPKRLRRLFRYISRSSLSISSKGILRGHSARAFRKSWKARLCRSDSTSRSKLSASAKQNSWPSGVSSRTGS